MWSMAMRVLDFAMSCFVTIQNAMAMMAQTEWKNAGLLFCMFVHALYWNARKTIKSFWGQWCPSGEKSNTTRGCPSNSQ